MPQLKSLYLRNFRNFDQVEIAFSPGINIIWGNNAAGKTNLLEAISLLAMGRSFRTQHLSELIREGESFFFLAAEILLAQVTHSIKLNFDGQNKKLQIDSTTFSSFNPLLGTLPLVLHSPADSELISGSPTYRRRFLNLHLAQSDPIYIHHFSRFWRAMKQRNALLRTQKMEEIALWEEEMARSANYIYQKRHELVSELKAPLTTHGNELISREMHEIRYHPSSPDNYLEILKKNRKRDSELGLTTAGPHRDDLSFWIGNAPAKTFASEGQKKTAAAALKLAEWDRLAHRLAIQPLMAVDDIGLALDPTRQTQFQTKLENLSQVFITTPYPPKDQGSHIQIHQGKIIPSRTLF